MAFDHTDTDENNPDNRKIKFVIKYIPTKWILVPSSFTRLF